MCIKYARKLSIFVMYRSSANLQFSFFPCWAVIKCSDGFTHRPNRQWPRAPRNSFLWRLIINLKCAKLRRGITSQFTLERAELQMSTLDPYQYSNNTTILCIWAWERCKPSLWKRLRKTKKKKRYLMINSRLTKGSQQRKTARHCKTPVKSNIVSIGSYVWLFLQDFP